MELADLERVDKIEKKSDTSSNYYNNLPEITIAKGDNSGSEGGTNCGSEVAPADDFETP